MNRTANRESRIVRKSVANNTNYDGMSEEEAENLKKTIQKIRLKRKPLQNDDILKYDERPGYYRRIVNDVKDGKRIKWFLDRGYSFVTEKNQEISDRGVNADSQMGAAVSRSVGGGVKAYLMEIPLEIYNEDQEGKLDKISESVRGLDPKNIENIDYGNMKYERD